jgi:hypothetical protein
MARRAGRRATQQQTRGRQREPQMSRLLSF